MSRAQLRFQVDSRLATLLSQEYPSSERALKELVDNAWDADAEHVSVTLPKPLSGGSIVIEDDGSGMTEEELRRHYLAIASDRRSRRGERTAGKSRPVKGRKGIGKFSGLMAAATMMLETRARGRLCRISLRLDDLARVEDIESALNNPKTKHRCGFRADEGWRWSQQTGVIGPKPCNLTKPTRCVPSRPRAPLKMTCSARSWSTSSTCDTSWCELRV